MSGGFAPHQAQDFIWRLERLKHRIDPSINRAEIVALTSAEFDAIEPHLKRVEEIYKPKAQKVLQGRELWESLAIAVVGFTRARRSARLNAGDLKDLIEQHCPGYDLSFWADQRAPAAAGLLQHEGWEKIVENGVRKVSELRKLIEARGVEFWHNWQDGAFRFVDSRWLESHADIYAWLVEKPWAGGRRCKFCAMTENPMVPELQPIEAERRNGVTMIGDTVVLDNASAALTHERCRPYFIEWQAIAKKYSSKAEAEAADKVAGRASRYRKVMEAARLEAPQ